MHAMLVHLRVHLGTRLTWSKNEQMKHNATRGRILTYLNPYYCALMFSATLARIASLSHTKIQLFCPTFFMQWWQWDNRWWTKKMYKVCLGVQLSKETNAIVRMVLLVYLKTTAFESMLLHMHVHAVVKKWEGCLWCTSRQDVNNTQNVLKGRGMIMDWCYNTCWGPQKTSLSRECELCWNGRPNGWQTFHLVWAGSCWTPVSPEKYLIGFCWRDGETRRENSVTTS